MSAKTKKLERKYRELQLLYRISSISHAGLKPGQVLKNVLRETVRALSADAGSIVLLDPSTGMLDIEAALGFTHKALRLKLKVGEGVTGWVAAHGKTLRVDDVREDSRYVPALPRIRCEMAVPLKVGETVFGVLSVDSRRPRAFSDEDQELLEALAAQAARVLHQSWIISQLNEKTQQFETLANIGQTVVSAVRLEDILHIAVREACRLLKTELCSLLLLTPDRQELLLTASHGASEDYSNKPHLKVRESLVGFVIKHCKPLTVLDVQENLQYQQIELARREKLVSLLSVPLVYGGQSIGVLNLYTKKQHRFSNDEIRIATALASLSAIAIEKARLNEKVLSVEDQLRDNERLSALGLLAAEIAHEIRNPLTVIKMLFHSIQQDFEGNASRMDDCRMVIEKMTRMNAIVDQVLTFARSSEPDLQPRDIDVLFEELQLLVRHKLTSQNIRLDFQIAPGMRSILLDRAQIEQALLNLILNALQAMPEGGTITLGSRMTQREGLAYAELSVTDDGVGMPEQVRELIFQPFLTTKAKGTGIGLAIVQKIVENHRGRIEVESEPGHGSTFRLLIPTE